MEEINWTSLLNSLSTFEQNGGLSDAENAAFFEENWRRYPEARLKFKTEFRKMMNDTEHSWSDKLTRVGVGDSRDPEEYAYEELLRIYKIATREDWVA